MNKEFFLSVKNLIRLQYNLSYTKDLKGSSNTRVIYAFCLEKYTMT